MAYFALVENGKVSRFHVVADAVLINDEGDSVEKLGQDLLESLHGIPAASWVQCSLDGEFRGSHLDIGFEWNPEMDAFIPPQPFDSWVLDEETFEWFAPLPRPEGDYVWDEATLTWVEA